MGCKAATLALTAWLTLEPIGPFALFAHGAFKQWLFFLLPHVVELISRVNASGRCSNSCSFAIAQLTKKKAGRWKPNNPFCQASKFALGTARSHPQVNPCTWVNLWHAFDLFLSNAATNTQDHTWRIRFYFKRVGNVLLHWGYRSMIWYVSVERTYLVNVTIHSHTPGEPTATVLPTTTILYPKMTILPLEAEAQRSHDND